MADYTDLVRIPLITRLLPLQGCEGVDTDPPTITVISPTPGGHIQPRQPFVFDVEDETELGLQLVTVELGLRHEVVWLRDSFAPMYESGSSRSEIVANRKYRYSVVRAGGWTSDPTFHVEVIDKGGNEAS